MNTTLNKRGCLTALLALSAMVFTASSFAKTDKLVIESGDSAQSRQQAAMEKEQWNDTRSLRQKVNTRAEKEWDKATWLLTPRITARRARTSTPTGNLTPCAALTAAPDAPLPRNVWRPRAPQPIKLRNHSQVFP
ncbi:Protein of uncharacterised function (DUF1283) [Klebsiella grimontii]|uniref:Protein of uncharacterized function (DUF1283) n=1 Tax=Klebsiella grimontii TaxID=2058152 RepID=A0A7H4P314_9ENTR|nr:Protein of uncharacterised function (DUF1283) [Klebsiella grimontii]